MCAPAYYFYFFISLYTVMVKLKTQKVTDKANYFLQEVTCALVYLVSLDYLMLYLSN